MPAKDDKLANKVSPEQGEPEIEVDARDSVSNVGLYDEQDKNNEKHYTGTGGGASSASVSGGTATERKSRNSFLRRTSTVSTELPPHFRDIDWTQRPILLDQDGSPVPTVIEFLMQPMRFQVEVKDGKEMLLFDLRLILFWTDHRLEGYPQEKDIPADIWRPEFLEHLNSVTLGGAATYEIQPTFALKERTEGKLQMLVPVLVERDLSEDLERFKAFPFDGTRVNIAVVAGGERRLEGTKDITYTLSTDSPMFGGGEDDKSSRARDAGADSDENKARESPHNIGKKGGKVSVQKIIDRLQRRDGVASGLWGPFYLTKTRLRCKAHPI
ncbi:unnamed protein product [Amoebophrya sp. A120]|nr:unnamed protein product [Amoebophrya sp. A120]|eukprot:GSA120T00016640001.1